MATRAGRVRRVEALAVGAALALVLAGCGSKGAQNQNATGDTLNLGASMSLSGALEKEGKLTQQGYDYCASTVNAKGGVTVGGRTLQLHIDYQDDQSQPDTAGQLVDQFNDKGYKLILGPYGSATTGAAMAVVERNGQVMVDSSGADDKLFTKGYRRTFAVLSPASVYAASIVNAINELASPKPASIVFLSADDGFSKTAAAAGEAQARRVGFTVVPGQQFPAGATDVSGALTKVKPSKPDVIVGSVHLAEGIAIIKQAAELGVTPTGGFAETVAPPTPDFAATLGAKANGVLSSSQWVPEVKGSEAFFGTATDYRNGFQAKFGQPPEYHNAEATAACLAMVFAVRKAGSTDPDPVRDALAGLDEQSFFGPLTFNDKGENVTKTMSVVQIQSGKLVTVWPKDQAAGPLTWPGTPGS
ncbi:MAG: amino acid ABC transporter substrate-binding protein [Pseudonocardiales bacterium]|nr:amino acid ABC transporter substrate-binding protein [Pseudonocardiales bacterium]